MNRRAAIALLVSLPIVLAGAPARSADPDAKLSSEELYKKYAKLAARHTRSAGFYAGQTARKTSQKARPLKMMADFQKKMALQAGRVANAARAGQWKRFRLSRKAYEKLQIQEQKYRRKIQ